MHIRHLIIVSVSIAFLTFPVLSYAQTPTTVRTDLDSTTSGAQSTQRLLKRITPVPTKVPNRTGIAFEEQKSLKTIQVIKRESIRDLIEINRLQASRSSLLKQEQLKIKLKLLKDQKKQDLVASISAKINKFNQTHTDRLAEVIDRIQSVLDRVSTKSAEDKAKGLDTVNLDQAIKDAQASIDNARKILTTQSGKSYNITITTDETVKSNVGAVISQFRIDLTAVYKAVVDARQNVMKAVKEAARLSGHKEDNTKPSVTPTMNPSPTDSATSSAGN